MNPLVLQFANGNVLFPGLLISATACALLLVFKRPVFRTPTSIAAILGAVLVLLSATPFPIWLYALWFASFVVALVLTRNPSENTSEKAGLTQASEARRVCPPALFAASTLVVGFLNSFSVVARISRLFIRARTLQQPSCILLASISLILFGLEVPHHFAPRFSLQPTGHLYVVGDSLSMGADTMEGNWPLLLGAKLGMPADNFSFGGARVRTALSNAKRVPEDTSLVILEIGGNDIFYNTDPATYAESLEEMLGMVCQPGRQVIMFELPLPPFYNRFGHAQRRLAKEYGVTLIPKRYLATVLGTPGATTDGLHLSNTGHALLADTVAGILTME